MVAELPLMMTALWISHRTGDLFTLIEWASLSSSSRSLFAVSGLAGCTWRERLHPPVGLGAAKAGLSDVTSRFSSIKSCCCWACTTTRWQTSGPAVSQESDRSNKEDTEVQLYRALFSLRLESVLLNVVPWGTTYRSPWPTELSILFQD